MTRSLAILVVLACVAAAPSAPAPPRLERVTTIAPYPRGLAMVDGELYVLCRGRVRGAAGGVSASVDDEAGTIYVVDPNVTEPVVRGREVSDAVRGNGRVYARPTQPPFRLWDRAADPPESDRETDRPYCTLRYDAATDSFYVCAFSGIDKTVTDTDRVAFAKNRADAILRYDRRTNRWYDVERHEIESGARYPAPAVAIDGSPRGWLEGPDNCLAIGSWLYAVAKDNSVLVRYDLRELQADPEAGPPPGEVVLRGQATFMEGHSALAYRDGWLYVGTRTTSVIARMKLDENFDPVDPSTLEVVARFDPWDRVTGRSANLTDMDFDDAGRLYVVSASPARIYRFTPDPQRVFDARAGRADPWLDLDALTRSDDAAEPVKSENVLHHDGWLYVTTGNGYHYQAGAHGTVYRVRVQ
ncbi:MAG: hypothetical protein GY715_12905 [Planctomycetes bacterium]|nr:hypothetical protein [Planctomycetota bacterium]